MPGLTTAIGNLAVADATTLEGQNSQGNYNPGQQGVFGLHPLMTPKYARNAGLRDNEFRESMARMYLSLADTDKTTKDLFIASLPNDPRVTALGQVLAINNAGFIDFFLQQITEPYSEAMQVDKVIGDNYVAFFFGQEPPVFQYSGTLLNSMQDDQRTGFALAYQHLLRGSQLAKRNALVRLRYDSVIVSGVMTSSVQSLNAENELVVPFQFSLLVKEYVWLKPIKGTKVTPEQYIALSDDFAKSTDLGGVGRAQDTRVRTVMNTPLTPNEESTAGTPQPVTPPDASQTPQQQLVQRAKTVATALATSFAAPFLGGTTSGLDPGLQGSGSSDVYGTVETVAREAGVTQ